MSFFAELKRRNVFRVGAAYLVLSWLLLQVVDVIAPILELPEWAPKLILLLIAVGFFPALFFAWAFELTPAGVKRERDVRRQDSITLHTGRRLDRVIIAVLVLAIGLMAAERMWLMPAGQPASEHSPGEAEADKTLAAEPVAAVIRDRSIAVLPFENRSAAGENSRFFSDGIHDDLLTLLSKIHELRVISRTSVMKYRNSEKNMRQIGSELGVSTLLEGGVQQAGNRVRINVQLINAQNDEHLWAETYDREVTTESIFDIQAEIARSIAIALEAELTPEEQVNLHQLPTASLEAYQAVLKSRQLEDISNFDSLEAAAQAARQAIALDSTYADAYLALANALNAAIETGSTTDEEAGAEIVAALETVMELKPDSAPGHVQMARYRQLTGKSGWEESFERAMQIDPNDSETQVWFGYALQGTGRPDRGLPLLLQAREQDPLSIRIHFALGRAYVTLSQWDKARQSFARIREIDPSSALGYGPTSGSYFQQGRLDLGLYWMGQAIAIDPDDYELGAWMLFLNQCLEDWAAADQWADWLGQRVTKQPFPIAMQAIHHYMNGNFELALQMSNLAMNMKLPNRWGSDTIFMRIKRDEALSNGNPSKTIALFRERYPEVFESPPAVDAGNLQQATDLALLLKLDGQMAEFHRLTDAIIEYYDQPYSASGAGRFWLMTAKAETLALRDERQAALAELRRIIDAGWRTYWRWETDLNHNFNGIRKTPEFRAMMNELSGDMAVQRANAQAMADRGEILAPPERGSQSIEVLLKEL